MYRFGYDEASLCLVSALSGAVRSDTDYEEMLAATLTLDVAGRHAGRPTVHVFLNAAEGAMPPMRWLWRFAELGTQLRAKTFFALVTTTPRGRRLLAKVLWLNPLIPARVAAFERFEDAARWAEARRGEPLPALARLFAEASRARPASSALAN